MEIVLMILLVIAGIYIFLQKKQESKITREKLDLLDEINSYDFTLNNKKDKLIILEEQLKRETISNNLTREALKKEVEGNKLLEALNKEYEKDIRDKNQVIENIQKLGCIGQQIKVLPDNTVELIANVSKDGTIFDIKGEQPKTVKRQYNKRKV